MQLDRYFCVIYNRRSLPVPGASLTNGSGSNGGPGRMDLLYFTVIGVGLYFFADWLLDRVERARGARFKHRDAIYFGIMLTAALLTFTLVNALHRAG